jgi:hypothetical protein
MSEQQSSPKPKPSPELEALIQQFVEAVRDESLPDNDILERATPRWEYRKCRNWKKMGDGLWYTTCPRCANMPHGCNGRYLYLYWKEKGKLKKKYMGKDPENVLNKKLESFFAELR